MKGLIVKDIVTLRRSHRRMFLAIFLIGGFLCATQAVMFSLVYMAILGAMMGITALNYDDADGGMGFLFTLPVSRRTYVRERYLFTLLCGLIVIGFGLLITVISDRFRDTGVEEDALFLPFVILLAFTVMMIATGFLIPLRLIFGGEKAVVAQTVFFLVIFSVGAIVPEAITRFTGIDIKENITNAALNAGPGKTIAVVVIAACVLLLLSEQISERIIMGKEY